jgi:hypothetical protein
MNSEQAVLPNPCLEEEEEEEDINISPYKLDLCRFILSGIISERLQTI